MTPVAMAAAIENAFDDELQHQRARARIDESVDLVDLADEWGQPTRVEPTVTPSAERLIHDNTGPRHPPVPQPKFPATTPPPIDRAEVGSLTSPSQTAVGAAPSRKTGVFLVIGLILAIFTLAAVLFVTRQRDKVAANQPETKPLTTPDAAFREPVTTPVDASARPFAIDARKRERPDPKKPDAAAVVIDAGAVTSVADAAPEPVEPDAAPVVKKTEYGFLTVNARPYGTVYINGRKAGVTPIIKKRLKVGRYRIKVVSSVDKTPRSRGVKIVANKPTSWVVKW